MTTATLTPAPATDDPYAGCGQDCVLIEGTCRCHAGETVAEAVPAWVRDIEPPF